MLPGGYPRSLNVTITGKSESRLAVSRYLKFSGLAVLVTVGVAAVGWKPTQGMVGSGGIEAMLAGCGISLLASLLGALPVTWSRGKGPQAVQMVLVAMVTRLGVVAILTTLMILSGRFLPMPLLLWVGLSHVALLIIDSRYALRTAREL